MIFRLVPFFDRLELVLDNTLIDPVKISDLGHLVPTFIEDGHFIENIRVFSIHL